MASQVQDPIAETAGNTMQQAGAAVDRAVDLAKQQATSRLESERERVAEGLFTSAHALRQVGQQLREQDQATIAGFAERVAQQVEQTSGYLRSRKLPEIVDDTEQLGRSYSMAFTVGALGLGILGVRFLKSSRRRQQAASVPQLPAYSDASANASVASEPSMSEGDGQSRSFQGSMAADKDMAGKSNRLYDDAKSGQSGFESTGDKLTGTFDDISDETDGGVTSEAGHYPNSQGATSGS
jgi:hypothetical protein